MAERLGNLGYFGLIKESTKGVPLTPTDYIPLYDETLTINSNQQQQQPIYGGKFMTYATLQGQRDHQGDITTVAEPNTIARLVDMLLTKGSTTGSDPYTHPFTLSASADPKSYTVDLSTGNVVKRFWGVEASSLSPDFNANEMRAKIKVSALGSFQARTIASVSTTTLTLDTAYDAAPTKGLVVDDLVRIYKASTGAVLNTAIASVDSDGITVTLDDSAAAFAQGDIIHLRPATPTFSMKPTFLWSKAIFGFGATASAALTNATTALQTRVEQGSTFEIMHAFEDDAGSKRSGGLDPAALVRLQGDATLTIKKFFDTPEDVQKFNDLTKSALVVRFFSGATNQYELRVTFNNITTDTPSANISAGAINYQTITFKPNYDTSDAQGIDIKVINGLSSI